MRQIACLLFIGFTSVGLASQNDALFPLQPMPLAPPAISKAGKAVVRISTVLGELGTGFFIEGGLFATNEHVIGPDNCTREGCYFDIDLNYQHGSKSKKVEVYAVPLVVASQSDVTILELYLPEEGKPKAARFVSPAELSFATQGPSLNEPLFIVGHSFGGLKRWSQSKAFRQMGDWCSSEHVCPPGNSGSPVLTEEGKLAGIVHRASNTGREIQDLTSARHIAYFSVATSFQNLISLDAPGRERTLASFSSIPESAPIRIDDEEEIDSPTFPTLENFVMRKLSQLRLATEDEETSVSVPQLLLRACLEEVQDEANAEDPDYEYDTCHFVRSFIDCTPDPSPGTFCPKAHERTTYQEAFAEIAEYRELNNGPDYLDWLLAVETDFAPTNESARAAGRKVLSKQLARTRLAALDFLPYVANLSSTPEEMNFEGVDYLDLLHNYSKQASYSPFLEEIGMAIDTLAVRDVLPRSDLKRLYKQLLSDEKLPANARAEIEADAYDHGLLTP